MTKKLTVGTESYDYPITGDENYGQDASGWAESITEAVAEIFGPGDIRTTETLLLNNTTGDITGLSFDTGFVQRIQVRGLITRKFNSSSTQTEAFVVEGSYNGVELNITVDYSGEDTKVSLFTNGGQFRYTSEDVPDTSELSVKFNATTIIDESLV